MSVIVLPSTDRWVSCSREVNELVARHRHVVHKGGITTSCSATASMPDVWRGNTTKPPCPACVAAISGSDPLTGGEG